jgi:hypothetical protein
MRLNLCQYDQTMKQTSRYPRMQGASALNRTWQLGLAPISARSEPRREMRNFKSF